MQDAEAGLGHQRAAVHAHAADGLRHPDGVAAEQLVILGGAQEAHDAQLHHEVVHDLLDFLFGDKPLLQVALEINIQEGGHAAQAHRRAVLLLDGAQVAEIGPLHRFPGVAGGP